MPFSKNKTKPSYTTGNKDFDDSRMNAKGLDDKPEKPIKGEFWASVGDVVDNIGSVLLSPNFGMILGYLGAGYCLTVSAIGYGSLLNIWTIAALPLALVSQFLQLLPRLPKYFPEQADKLTFKLGLTRYLDPKEDKNSPTLLVETKEWARQAHKTRQRAMETVSAILYLMEFIGGSIAFKVVDPVMLTLIPSGVFNLVTGVIGFEACLIFTEWMKGLRLTARESRKYRELKRKQQIEAEASFSNN